MDNTLRKAAEMALAKLEHLWDIGIDAEYKVELLPEIEALRQALAQPEQGCAECGKKASDGWALYCVKCMEQEPINKMPTKLFGPNLEEILNAAGFYRQPEQEPVAWVRDLTSPQPHCVTSLKYLSIADTDAGVKYIPVYTAPPSKHKEQE